MQRKAFLVGIWLLIGCAVGLFLISVGPVLLARYYISQLVPTGTPSADAAYLRLKRSGRWAVPALLQAANERDPHLAELRQGNVSKLDGRDPWRALQKFCELRQASPLETRSDLCAALLLSSWDEALLTERERRELLQYVHWGAIEVPREVCSLDAEQLPVKVYQVQSLLHSVQSFSLYHRFALVVRTETGEKRIPAEGWWGQVISQYGRPPSFANRADPAEVLRHGWSTGKTDVALSPNDLGVGKHAIYLVVSVGLSTKFGTRPPWFEELVYGPAEVEIVARLSCEQQTTVQISEEPK